MPTSKKIKIYLLSVALVALFFGFKYIFWPQAGGNTVLGISHNLACPCECPMVLEDCHMSCGLEWKDMIGQKLQGGLTKEEIVEYFYKRYGDEAMLTIPQRLGGKWYQFTRGGFPLKEALIFTAILFVWGGVVYLIIAALLSKFGAKLGGKNK